jgi:hypothetical protein
MIEVSRYPSVTVRPRRATFTNMIAPVAFAAFGALTGRYDLAFMISGVLTLICVPLLWGIDAQHS